MQAARRPDDEPEPSQPSRGRNLPVAIVTGLALAATLVTTLFTSLAAYTALVTAAVLVALFEFYRTVGGARGLKPALPLGLAAALIIVPGVAWRGPIAMSFGVVAAAVAAFVWYLVDPERQHVTQNLAVTILGVVYVPLFAAHVVAMRTLPHGASVTMVFFVLAVFNDVGAYAVGSFIGKHKIAPLISPSKSWEGAVGAAGIVFLFALTATLPFPGLSVPARLGLAAIVSIAAPLGDFTESLMKRDLGVKDMGGLLPGHGGMLDRIDALLFVAPFAYWYLRAVL